FFTSSSIATLPIALESAKKAGVSESTANFSLPLGAIFHSDGGALSMGVSLVFAAYITGLNLDCMDYIMIVIFGTLLSVVIAGVDALIGMGGTASNVTGDIVGAAVIDKKKVSPSS